ncbi:MAG TPA: translocation/assembly module TamB domain-containing protein, partial [Cytophagales bacterium]|nr:translocation/assembly module TamB domain-containing protein [Cytophagales bacterium]
LQDKAKALKGMDLDAKIRIHPHTSLKILIDPYTGDSLVVRGKSDLNFSMDPSGKMSLSGIYTVSGGSYNAYIEGLMPKKFDLVEGGRIIWNGDPLDAQVDLSAKYNIRTSAAELMTIGGGGGVIRDSSTLSRPLLFEVYLLMRGELLKPKISFKLDMPENQRAIGGGAIYGKVGELNQNEAELNKQVFSLLVLNKFLPATPTGSGGGGMSGFARSSVSRLMSDQLNQLSGQYLKGVELNVDVQSYNYNQGGKSQANTQVNVGVKKEFNRLSVQVGSNVPVEGNSNQQSNVQNLTGDVQVGYKLTKDGRYRLKAFRQNQVDNIANGVVAETGAGVLYSKDYNKTKELFNFLRRKKKKK